MNQRTLTDAAPDLLELLILALPYVEEGEENFARKRTLSKRIRAFIKAIGGAE